MENKIPPATPPKAWIDALERDCKEYCDMYGGIPEAAYGVRNETS